MEPYKWKLVKTPNGKMKVVLDDADMSKYTKDWPFKIQVPKPSELPISEMQIMIDDLEIKYGFP
jgi:hypothetical protein